MNNSRGVNQERLAFSKLVGTGNDFIFIDARDGLPACFSSIARSELVKKISNRNFGVGSDGVVFVERGARASTLKWDFYNSDGSTAEMCGNATRCMGRWAQRTLGHESIEFETVAGRVRATVSPTEQGGGVSSELSFVKVKMRVIDFEVDGVLKKAHLIDTGVPHAVFEVEKIEMIHQAKKEIAALRFHPASGPRGANVTFLARLGPAKFATVTFERGVEGFTLSCGTGVLAAAAVGLAAEGGLTASVTTPGGDLRVAIKKEGGVILSGPAEFVFEAELTKEILR